MSPRRGYVAASYADSAAVQANPQAAPMLMNVLGTGGGARLGSLIGLVASESGCQLTGRNFRRQGGPRQRRLVGQSLIVVTSRVTERPGVLEYPLRWPKSAI